MSPEELQRLRVEAHRTDGKYQNTLEHGCRKLLRYLPEVEAAARADERARVLAEVAEIVDGNWVESADAVTLSNALRDLIRASKPA